MYNTLRTTNICWPPYSNQRDSAILLLGFLRRAGPFDLGGPGGPQRCGKRTVRWRDVNRDVNRRSVLEGQVLIDQRSQERVSDLVRPCWGAYGIVYRVLPLLLEVGPLRLSPYFASTWFDDKEHRTTVESCNLIRSGGSKESRVCRTNVFPNFFTCTPIKGDISSKIGCHPIPLVHGKHPPNEIQFDSLGHVIFQKLLFVSFRVLFHSAHLIKQSDLFVNSPAWMCSALS